MLPFFPCRKILFFLAAVALATSGLARADAAGDSALALSLWDANPKFLNGVTLPLEKDAGIPRLAAAIAKHGKPRKGAAADGVSLLLVRARCPQPGIVAFALQGAGPLGRLGTTMQPDAKTVNVNVATSKNKDGDHTAWALFRPPEEFGKQYAGKAMFSRNITIKAVFSPREKDDRGKAASELPLQIVRPPVVLVHGLYHSPAIGWQTRPPLALGKLTMPEHLRSRGFKVFLADYRDSSGKRVKVPSHFRDNQMVVWEKPGGIREALRHYREKLNIAATQADVVGHSMGGLLARAYAKGTPLPPCGHEKVRSDRINAVNGQERPKKSPMNRATTNGATTNNGNWYLRADNFHRGDIRRLMSLCTAHHGSDLVRLLVRFRDAAKRAGVNADHALKLIEMFRPMSDAFRDHEPGGEALAAIGPTPLAAHAVACVADPEDFDHFHELYRWQFAGFYLLFEPVVWRELFTDKDVNQPKHAMALFEFAREHDHLKKGLLTRMLRAVTRRKPLEETDAKRRAEYTEAVRRFTTAVFRDAGTDGAVSELSAHGGLRGKYVTTIPHVTHSYAARYAVVQNKVSELLEAGLDPFSPDGFPATVARDSCNPPCP